MHAEARTQVTEARKLVLKEVVLEGLVKSILTLIRKQTPSRKEKKSLIFYPKQNDFFRFIPKQ